MNVSRGIMKNEIFLGDCLDVMLDIPDNSIDLICADLPYQMTGLGWDFIIPFDKLWEQYNRISKETTPIILFGKQPFTTDIINSNRKDFKYELIWEKDKPTNFAMANKQPMCYHENILVFYKKQPIYNKQFIDREGKGTWRYDFDISHDNRKMQNGKKYQGKKDKSNYDTKTKNPKSILYYDTGRRQKLVHPTQKPVELLEWIVRTYSNEGDLVLDNTAGSSTTAVACLKNNRSYIMIEKDVKYHKISTDRINDILKDINSKLF